MLGWVILCPREESLVSRVRPIAERVERLFALKRSVRGDGREHLLVGLLVVLTLFTMGG